jgi:hydroxymethylpyrimidine pyrophosphatase-like HAD family hydrolase
MNIQIKAFSFDLDGTILNSNGQIPISFISLIYNLINDNRVIVFNTGRSLSEFQKIKIPEDILLYKYTYVVLMNGFVIYNKKIIIKQFQNLDHEKLLNFLNDKSHSFSRVILVTEKYDVLIASRFLTLVERLKYSLRNKKLVLIKGSNKTLQSFKIVKVVGFLKKHFSSFFFFSVSVCPSFLSFYISFFLSFFRFFLTMDE